MVSSRKEGTVSSVKGIFGLEEDLHFGVEIVPPITKGSSLATRPKQETKGDIISFVVAARKVFLD